MCLCELTCSVQLCIYALLLGVYLYGGTVFSDINPHLFINTSTCLCFLRLFPHSVTKCIYCIDMSVEQNYSDLYNCKNVAIMSSCWHLWIQKISLVFLWKKVLPILSHLSFLSRTQSSLHHGFCATDKWRCVRAVYQPSKSSLNLALIPQITQRSFWRPLTWRPLWWAPCLLQTGWQSSLPLLSSLYSSVFCTAGCFPL